MAELDLQVEVFGEVGTNVYLAVNRETKEAFLTDPADDAETIAKWIRAQELTLKGILLTHGHFDHILAVNDLKREFQVPVYAMKAEHAMLADPMLNLSGSRGISCSIRPDVELLDEQQFMLAGFAVTAYHTPGHTKGSGCYLLAEENILLAGDTIFCESFGRTDLPTGSFHEMFATLDRMLVLLEDEVRIYPGHGAATTGAHEKKYNPYVTVGPGIRGGKR